MQINSQKLMSILQKVRIVREHLQAVCHEPQGPVLSIMNLHWAIQDIYKLTIEMRDVSFDADHLRGKVERYSDNRARILVRSRQSDEEKRFATAKELCHLMIDEEDDWSVQGVDTISGLLMEWKLQQANGVGHTHPTDPLQSEILAEIAAVEFMYPAEYRATDIAKLAESSTTIARISLEHELPAYQVETAIIHHEMLAEHWNKIC
jgi:IrrE N-terminal-like domain